MTKLNKYKFRTIQITLPPDVIERIKQEKEKRYFNVSALVAEFLKKKFKIKD